MRVAHVITRLIVGGAQENTVASVLGLRQKPGLDVRLLSGPTTGPEGSIESEVTAVPNLLTLVPELVRPVRPVMDMRALRRLTRIFRDYRPDIVHTHSGKAGVLGRIAAHRARVPVIVHTIHGPSFGRFQGPLTNAMFRIAERCASTMRLYIRNIFRVDSRDRLGFANHLNLPLEARCSEPNFLRAIIVDRRAKNDCLDVVIIVQRIGQPLQHDDT